MHAVPPFGWPATLVQEFPAGTAAPGKPGFWETTYPLGGRTNAGNRELELYVDPGFRNHLGEPAGTDPFVMRDGTLSITATRLALADRPRFDGYRYLSGMISSYHAFSQTYGYFEARVKVPRGKGLWPAFWMLPVDHSWPPEIDILEVLGDRPSRLYLTVHSAAAGGPAEIQKIVDGPDLSADFHDYGVRWTPTTITWFLDGVEKFRTSTPVDLHKPMYLILNLAVGGNWPGAPDRATTFPASLQVRWIHGFSLPSGASASEAYHAPGRDHAVDH